MADGGACDGGGCGAAMGDCDGGGFDMGDMGDMGGCDTSFGISNYHPVDLFQSHAAGDVVLLAGGLFSRPRVGDLKYVNDSAPNTCYLLFGVIIIVLALTLGGIYLIPLIAWYILSEHR